MHSDSHAHLTMEPFDADREAVIERARAAGLAHVVTVSSYLGDAARCAELAARCDFIHFTAGVHPHEAKGWTPEVARAIRAAATRPKAVAIGEIGLDYHYDYSPRERQRSVFREQIALARDLGLPIVIHTREAWPDTFAILKEERAADVGGVFHCFSGGPEEARLGLDLGFYLSFAGPVTFKNARALAEAAAYAPLDRILTETDAPYLAPHPHRGTRNEPARVVLVAERIAALRGIDATTVGGAATRNLESVFRLRA
ncbi:MAG TPA: TatD family hydrolase [Candidatus Polarisedimenticolia bacterium]|nr:TatD family hydrolase [Candidatus Polarisedimenticolia bacterium]